MQTQPPNISPRLPFLLFPTSPPPSLVLTWPSLLLEGLPDCTRLTLAAFWEPAPELHPHPTPGLTAPLQWPACWCYRHLSAPVPIHSWRAEAIAFFVSLKPRREPPPVTADESVLQALSEGLSCKQASQTLRACVRSSTCVFCGLAFLTPADTGV